MIIDSHCRFCGKTFKIDSTAKPSRLEFCSSEHWFAYYKKTAVGSIPESIQFIPPLENARARLNIRMLNRRAPHGN